MSDRSNTKISIITCCYNSENFIRDMIESILKQNYMNFEHVVIDGGSTDNTLNIFNDYKEQYKDRLILTSEPDKGISDALNKGLKKATGSLVGILCSDDFLYDESVLFDIANTYKDTKCDGVYGNLLFVNREKNKILRRFISKTGNYKLGWHPPFPAMYISREIYEEIGEFSLNLKTAADYDMQLRMLKQNINLTYINKYLVTMRGGGVSNGGLKGHFSSFKESWLALKLNKIRFPLLVTILKAITVMKESIIK